MGVVWGATHLITQKQVALKFMLAASPELTERFIREARSAGAVRHPNVVNIHDVLPLPDGTPLMVMEMLEGEALSDKLTRQGTLSAAETAQIMVPVVSAVAAAHAVGIVHRDLKPENIYLATYAGGPVVPKVLDFGIAKLMPTVTGDSGPALTRTGSMLGTPYYMSPEQIYGEKDVDGRADVWALGVILYLALTGRRAFDGENFGQLLKSVTSGQLAPVASIAPWVPQHLSHVVERMLRVDRSTRLADLREVEHALTASAGAWSSPNLPATAPSASSGIISPSLAGVTPPPMSHSQIIPKHSSAPLVAGGVALFLAATGFAAFLVHRPSTAVTAPGRLDVRPTAVVTAPPTPLSDSDSVVASASSVPATPSASASSARHPVATKVPPPSHGGPASSTAAAPATPPATPASAAPARGLSTAVPF